MTPYDELLENIALGKYSTPHGNANPQTHSYIEGLKDGLDFGGWLSLNYRHVFDGVYESNSEESVYKNRFTIFTEYCEQKKLI